MAKKSATANFDEANNRKKSAVRFAAYANENVFVALFVIFVNIDQFSVCSVNHWQSAFTFTANRTLVSIIVAGGCSMKQRIYFVCESLFFRSANMRVNEADRVKQQKSQSLNRNRWN